MGRTKFVEEAGVKLASKLVNKNDWFRMNEDVAEDSATHVYHQKERALVVGLKELVTRSYARNAKKATKQQFTSVNLPVVTINECLST